jgi:hypothetical protein
MSGDDAFYSYVKFVKLLIIKVPHPGFVLRQNLPSPHAGRGMGGGVKSM